MKENKLIILAVIAYIALVMVSWNDTIEKTKDGRAIITFWHTYNDLEEGYLKDVIKEFVG